MVARFFSLAVSELFLRGAKFLFFLLLANFFDERAIYEYGYFTAFFSLIFVFSDFGFQTYVIPLLSRSKRVKVFLEYVNIALFRLFFYVLFAFPVLIFYSFFDHQLYIYVFLLFLSDAIFAMHFAYLRSLEKSKEEAKIKFFIAVIFIVATILALASKSLHVSFIFLTTSWLIYGVFISTFLKRKFIALFFKHGQFSSLKGAATKSRFIFLGALATMIYLRVDILMLDWLDTQRSVALYSVASRVLELSMVVPMGISAIILPKLSNSLDENIKLSMTRHFFIGIIVMAIFLFISNFIVQILFSQYIDAVPLLNILLLSIPIVLVNNYIFSYFIAKDLSVKYAIVAGIVAALNVVLNAFVIPKYSYIGASWTTVFTEFLGMVLGVYLLMRAKKKFVQNHLQP